MIYLDAAPPGTHNLVPLPGCGTGDGAINLLVLKFYYCAFDADSLISSGIAMALTLAFVLIVTARVRDRVPGKLQMVLEFLVGYTRGLVRESVAEDASFVVPLAATIGLFIFIANWLDFFPLSQPVFPANAILDQTVAMAIVVIVLVEAYSLRVLGFRGFLRRFTKPFELNLVIRGIFVLLNVIEEVVKPVTLALRLFGNIFAGVLMVFLLGALFSYGLQTTGLGHVWAPLGLLFLIIWKAFDVFFVGTIQAFIFMLLTIIYFGMAREGLEQEERPARRRASPTAFPGPRGAATEARAAAPAPSPASPH